MKIVDVKVTPIPIGRIEARMLETGEFEHWAVMGSCLVEVETDEGVTGIGEAWAGGPEIFIGIKAFIEKGYKSVLLGEDPINYRSLWDKMHTYSWYADTGIGMCALSGVDMALMDLTGKALGVPVCKIMGGCYRIKLRVYASHPAVTPKTHKEACKEAVELIEKGYTAIKMSFTAFPNFGENLRGDIKYVKEIRDAIGDDIDLMISEAAPPRSVSKAIGIARNLEKYNVLCYEEPLPRGDIEGYAKLTAAVDLPIVAGEEMTNQMLKNFILRGAVDVINPDATQIGGLSESKKIADLASTVGIKNYPHHFTSAVGLAANAHLVASMPHDTFTEVRTSFPDPSMEELLEEPLKFEKGYLKVPKGPGLGIKLNRKVVEKIKWKV